MAAHNELGRWGEEMAVRYLERKGYVIVERDWKSGHRDIDIIALDDSTVVFVEVKTRTDEDVLPAVDAVDARKRQRIIYAAESYIRMCPLNLSPRFDIITVVGSAPNQQIEHIPDAFLPPVRTHR